MTHSGLAIGLMGLLLLVGGGCAHFPGGVAPSNTPLENRKYTVLGRTEATDSYYTLFGLIPLTGANSTRRAMKDAIAQGGGDALIDVTVESYFQYWILFTRNTIRVDGTAIRFNP